MPFPSNTPEPSVHSHECATQSSLPRPLGIATNDLNLIRLNRRRILKLERDVLDQEGPDFVAEAVGIEMTLSHT